MDAILLCMKKKGIRFFSKITFPNTIVFKTYERNSFLKLLRSRKQFFDNVLIMAHGANNAILTTSRDPNKCYTTYIEKKDADAFKNNFVFAVSCLTANEFGKCCVAEKGCIAYLGYQVEIGCLFCAGPGPKSNTPGSVITAVNTIVKHIFVSELSKSFEVFLKTPVSVQVLRQRFAFELEKRLSELLDMDADQVYSQYQIRIRERHYKAFAVDMILEVLSQLDNILPKLICIGDDNYISSSFIRYRIADGFSSSQISAELNSNPFFQRLAHTEYKKFLKDYAASF